MPDTLRTCDRCERTEPAHASPDWPDGVCPECAAATCPECGRDARDLGLIDGRAPWPHRAWSSDARPIILCFGDRMDRGQ